MSTVVRPSVFFSPQFRRWLSYDVEEIRPVRTAYKTFGTQKDVILLTNTNNIFIHETKKYFINLPTNYCQSGIRYYFENRSSLHLKAIRLTGQNTLLVAKKYNAGKILFDFEFLFQLEKYVLLFNLKEYKGEFMFIALVCTEGINGRLCIWTCLVKSRQNFDQFRLIRYPSIGI